MNYKIYFYKRGKLYRVFVVFNSDNFETNTNYSELQEQIKIITASMPEKKAIMFELCFMKQFTYKETAEAMNVSVKTVENHMALAFKDMCKSLI